MTCEFLSSLRHSDRNSITETNKMEKNSSSRPARERRTISCIPAQGECPSLPHLSKERAPHPSWNATMTSEIGSLSTAVSMIHSLDQVESFQMINRIDVQSGYHFGQTRLPQPCGERTGLFLSSPENEKLCLSIFFLAQTIHQSVWWKRYSSQGRCYQGGRHSSPRRWKGGSMEHRTSTIIAEGRAYSFVLCHRQSHQRFWMERSPVHRISHTCSMFA